MNGHFLGAQAYDIVFCFIEDGCLYDTVLEHRLNIKHIEYSLNIKRNNIEIGENPQMI